MVEIIKLYMIKNKRDDFVNYLAEILGISKQWASAKLRGKSMFTEAEIGKLDRVLDFDAEQLKKALRGE